MPPLPYDYAALEPHIDEQTMRIHHDKHHAAYVTNLNAALEGESALQSLSIEQLLGDLGKVPEAKRTAVRNNGGGHANHTLFWELMTPGGASRPDGQLASAIDQSFGSFDAFKEQFAKACVERFGSGWGWLAPRQRWQAQHREHAQPGCAHHGRELPGARLRCLGARLLSQVPESPPDYVAAWWNVVNWTVAGRRFAAK